MRRNRGFTLIEVLVAFALMALFLAILFQAVSGGFRAQMASDRHANAAMVARSVLAFLEARPLEAGAWSGESADGLIWTVAVEPAALAADEDGEPLARLWQVTVSVRWDADTPGIALRTLRAAAVPPPETP